MGQIWHSRPKCGRKKCNLQKLNTRLFEYIPPEFEFHFIFFPLENIEQIRLVFISVRWAVEAGRALGWFKMHDVFRYWLPGHFCEGLYVK